MKKPRKRVIILMADDDSDDRLLISEVLQEVHFANEVRFVTDGEALMDYLLRQGEYHQPAASPRPDLILLDLNMPKKGGLEALAEIKNNSKLRHIPVVVLTTSQMSDDIQRSYDLGANSFVVKSASFDGLTEAMMILGKYWFDIVELPE